MRQSALRSEPFCLEGRGRRQAASLAFEPALQVGACRRVPRIGSEVDDLARFGGLILEFDAGGALVPFRVAPPIGAHGAAHNRPTVARTQNLREGDAAQVANWIGKQRREVAAGESFGQRDSGPAGDGRVDIDELYDRG